jgi:hypothetical protein
MRDLNENQNYMQGQHFFNEVDINSEKDQVVPKK